MSFYDTTNYLPMLQPVFLSGQNVIVISLRTIYKIIHLVITSRLHNVYSKYKKVLMVSVWCPMVRGDVISNTAYLHEALSSSSYTYL